jgi:hypothetical protein
VKVLWSPKDYNMVRSKAARGLKVNAFSDLLEVLNL